MPTVSIAIPALNEIKYIDRVLETFARSAYPAIVEIFVIDGGSRDCTQARVVDWTARDPRIRLLDNPHRFQSFALNIALQQARGKIFLRADAHCIYAPDYVERCVEALLHSHALNVGGAQRFIAANWLQAATSIAIRSFIGSGGARYKRTDYDGYAETVFLGCFWRSAVMAVGGYSRSALINEDYDLNTRLKTGPFSVVNVTNQDAELNMRLILRNREGVYISSAIKVWYWPRPSLSGLAIQYFNYGRGRALTSLKHLIGFSRGHAPYFALVTITVVALVELLAFGRIWVSTVFVTLIGVVCLIEAICITWKTRAFFTSEIWRGDLRRIPGIASRAFGVWLVFGITNLCHACGFGYQLARILGTVRFHAGRLTLELRW